MTIPVFRGIAAPEPPTFPATLEEVLQKHPNCEIARKWRAAEASKAARARLNTERQKLEAQLRRAQAVINEATPESDFLQVAAAKAEAEVVQKHLDRVKSDGYQEGGNNAIASFEGVWQSYTARLRDVRNHREPTGYDDPAFPRKTLSDKVKAVEELLKG